MEITYYTDPLCCWSWCLQPVVDKLRTEWKEPLHWRNCMGGLIPSWKNYADPVNNVSRPLQMGPVWMHASAVGGAEIDSKLWFKDPPASSYPSCIAVKAVELQSAPLSESYLRQLREACMLQGINIAKKNELVRLAAQLGKQSAAFDLDVFIDDLVNGRAREAFRNDLHEISARGITRFPTLIIRHENGSWITTGFRPYHVLYDLISGITAGSTKKPVVTVETNNGE